MDEQLRRLERAAGRGDTTADEALQRARVRAGRLCQFGRTERPALPSLEQRFGDALVVGRVNRRGRLHVLNAFCLILEPTLRPLCGMPEARREWVLSALHWGQPTCALCRRELKTIRSVGVTLAALAGYQCGVYEPGDLLARVVSGFSAFSPETAVVALETIRGLLDAGEL